MKKGKKPIYCSRQDDPRRCKKCIDMFDQTYCLVRVDQRRFQGFEEKTENELSQAGEGSWGYTEASYGRTILYDGESQEKSDAYLQGSLTFTDRILYNLTTFLREISNSEEIIAKVKHSVLSGLNNRQQLKPDDHDEVGYFGKINIVTYETGFVKEIKSSIRHTTYGFSILLQIGKGYEDRAKNAFCWIMKKVEARLSEPGIFGKAVDYSCIIKAHKLFKEMFPENRVVLSDGKSIVVSPSTLSPLEGMYSYLETDALYGKDLYGKDTNDPIRILSSLWVLDNIPSLKANIMKNVLQAIIKSEREAGIPFWLGPWPKGRKELDCLIPSNLSNKPDFGLTASLVNILCRDSTVSACGDEFCRKYAEKYFDWLIKNYREKKYFHGTNSRQWSYLLSLPLCETVRVYFEKNVNVIEESIVKTQEKLTKNTRFNVDFGNRTFRNIFRIRILNERLFENGELNYVFPSRPKIRVSHLLVAGIIFVGLTTILVRYFSALHSMVLSAVLSVLASVLGSFIYERIKIVSQR